MAQKILGLDLGSRQVKAVVLEGTFRSFVVKRYLTAPVPQDEDLEAVRPIGERLGEALAALTSEENLGAFKADAVIAAVPESEVATHVLSLPFTEVRKIDQTLAFELEDQIPFDLRDVVFDYQVLGQRDGKTEVLVAVVRRAVLEDLLARLAGAGLDPRVMSLSALAYQNLFAHGVIQSLPPPPPPEPGLDDEAPTPAGPVARTEAVLDIGHAATTLLVLEDGVARFARTFPIAGRALTDALASAENLHLSEAEDLKEAEGTLDTGSNFPERARLAGILEKGLAPLVRGIRQTLLAYSARARNRVERVHLTGGTARLPGLPRYLASALGCEVVALDPFPEGVVPVEVEGPAADDPAAGLAMSLALRGQGGPRISRIDFRKGPLAFHGDLSYMKGNVSRLAVLAALVLAVVGVNIWAHFHTLEIREQQVDQAICQLTQRVLGRCYTDPDDAISRLKGTKANAGIVPRVSATDVLAAVSQRIGTMQDIDLSELDVSGAKVRLAGLADSFDAVAKMVKKLQTYSCFGNVNQGQTRQSADGKKIEFNVDATMAAECSSS